MTPIMTDTPRSVNIIATSQLDLRNSFNYLKSALNKDHVVEFDKIATAPGNEMQGRHKQVSFNNRTLINQPLPGGTNGLLHVSGGNLYWTGPGTATSVQMSNDNVGTPSAASPGYTFLPGGLLMCWGDSTTTSSAVPNAPLVVFPKAFSAVPYNIQLTVQNLSGVSDIRLVNIWSLTATNFGVFATNSSNTLTSPIKYYWLAIGPK